MNLALHRTGPSPLRMPSALWVSLAAVVLAHAAIVARQWDGFAVSSATSHAASATRVRLVAVQPEAPVAEQPVAAVDDAATQLGPLRFDATLPVSSGAWGADGATPQPAPVPETGLPAQAAEAPPARDRDEDLYVPRSRLSVPPVAQQQIRVDFPASFQDRGDYTVVLSLFIDEAGVVRRVRVDSVGVPSDLQDAASQAFLHARYSPGQVDGQPVKSLIRIAVGFEDDRA